MPLSPVRMAKQDGEKIFFEIFLSTTGTLVCSSVLYSKRQSFAITFLLPRSIQTSLLVYIQEKARQLNA